MPKSGAHNHYGRRWRAGLLAGWYLYVCAVLVVVTAIGAAIATNELYIPLVEVILLLWGGAMLRRYRGTARKIVIGVLLWIVMGMAAIAFYALSAGTEGWKMWLFGFAVASPPTWLLVAYASVTALIFTPPLCILLTPRARREFGHTVGDDVAVVFTSALTLALTLCTIAWALWASRE